MASSSSSSSSNPASFENEDEDENENEDEDEPEASPAFKHTLRAKSGKRKLASFGNRSDSSSGKNMTAAAQVQSEAHVGIHKTLEHSPRLFIVDERSRGAPFAKDSGGSAMGGATPIRFIFSTA